MRWFLLVFAFGSFVLLLFGTYMAFFRDWGRKHFLAAKKYPFTPDYLITLFGERFYIIYYKVGVIITLLGMAGFCVPLLINWDKL